MMYQGSYHDRAQDQDELGDSSNISNVGQNGLSPSLVDSMLLMGQELDAQQLPVLNIRALLDLLDDCILAGDIKDGELVILGHIVLQGLKKLPLVIF
jgi:hypothetical protein